MGDHAMGDEDENESSTDQDNPEPHEELDNPEPEEELDNLEPDQDDAASDAEHAEPTAGRVFSVYGIASTVLGILSAAAIVLGLIMWSAHRDDVDERAYQSRVMRAAVGWTSALINMSPDNVDVTLERLREKTIGQLDADFESTMAPYRETVQKLQSRLAGRIDSVAIESVRYDPNNESGTQPPASSVTGRTANVLVVATSIAENTGPGGKPRVVHWDLSLDVSDVDGKLLISRMSSIR